MPQTFIFVIIKPTAEPPLRLKFTCYGKRNANLAIISHSATEFILDFASVLPGLPKAKVRSRVILAPEHAKRLLLSLQENVARYENTFGPIPVRQGTPRDGGKGGFNMGEA